jgi:hypothetical protein
MDLSTIKLEHRNKTFSFFDNNKLIYRGTGKQAKALWRAVLRKMDEEGYHVIQNKPYFEFAKGEREVQSTELTLVLWWATSSPTIALMMLAASVSFTPLPLLYTIRWIYKARPKGRAFLVDRRLRRQ